MSNENPPEQGQESQQGQEQNTGRRSSRIFDWFFSRGVTIPILVSALLIVAGLYAFGIEPWYVLQGAVESYRQAKLKDSVVEHHLEMGNSFLNVGRPEAAAAEYEEALKLDPTNARVQLSFRKSELFTQMGERNYDPATMRDRIRQLADVSASDLTSDFNDVHQSHMRAFEGDIFSMYHPDTAEGLYKEATSLNSENSYAFAQLAVLYDEQGKPEEALEMAEKAYDMARWHSNYQSNVGFMLYENKRYSDSIATYEDLLKWDGEYVATYFELPIVYRVQGDLEAAHWYQTYLIEELLEDQELAELEKNKGALFYPTQSGRPVYLPKDREKKYYAYYSAALTSYLLGDEEEAEKHANSARDIDMPTSSKLELKRLMEHDIQTLQEAQDSYSSRTDDFKSEFLDQEEIEPAAAVSGKAEAKAGKTEAKAGGVQAKTLPSTGGAYIVVALLGPGAATLLVVGGLLARRISW